MTPQEHAEKLVSRFEWADRGNIEAQKRSALETVSEIIEALTAYGEANDELQNMDRELAWWDKVEEQIKAI